MVQYEIKYQSREMRENNEWGKYYYEHWRDAVELALEMKDDPEIIVIQVSEIHTITFKDESEE